MHTKTVEKVIKNSIVYGYAVTQPFLLYVDLQPPIHDALLQESETLKYGENSGIVRHFQHKLSNLGYYEDGIDGKFGLLTEHAVKGFQSSNRIEVTGQIDQNTMEQLLREEKKARLNDIKSEIEAIYFGAQNEKVKIVQEVLFYYGYYKGNIDGIYGNLTEEALQKVRSENLLDDTTEIINNENMEQQEGITKKKKDQKKEEVIQLEVTNSTNVIEEARNHLGSPYVWGGTSPSGFDCSGFIQFVYNQNNKTIPRTVNEIWNFASPVNSPAIGDLVFFETYQAGPSHLGIYLGNGDFIHAGSSTGVTVSNMKETDYWQTRYIGSKRIQ